MRRAGRWGMQASHRRCVFQTMQMRRAGELERKGLPRPARRKDWAVGESDEGCCDQNQKRPGEEGFIPSMQSAAGRTAEEMMQQLLKGYDDGYRDINGARAIEVHTTDAASFSFWGGGLTQTQSGRVLKTVPGKRAWDACATHGARHDAP